MLDSIRSAWSRLRATFSADRIAQEFDAELRDHLAMSTDELRRSGMTEADARREAARRLGRLDPLRDDHRAARGLPALDVLVQAVRHATRRLARTPVFAGIVTLTLAIGIGANTALFSLVDNLLLRTLPVRDPEQLVEFAVHSVMDGQVNGKPSAGEFKRTTFAQVAAQSQGIAGVVGYRFVERPRISIDGVAQTERAIDYASTNFFRELDVPLVIGRYADDSDGNVIVISERWWRSRFGGSLDALGRAISVDDRLYTVIGVAPLRFHGFEIDRSVDAWISPGSRELGMVARLRAGVTRAQAAALVHNILITEVLPADRGDSLVTIARSMSHGISDLRAQYQKALIALMALVLLVLLTTCANVGNLVMLRHIGRRRELTMRATLGASRARLVIHSLVETSMLAIIGCVGGLVFAAWAVRIVVALLPLPAAPDALAFHLDARMLAFVSIVCALSVLLFGLVPAWRAADVDLAGTLQSSHAMSAPARTRRVGRLLVGAQVALSVVLIVGAGLFVQTLRNLSKLQMGYGTERLVQVTLDPRFAGYQEKQVPALARHLLERVASVPGVRSVSRTSWPLMIGSSTSMGIPLPNLPDRPGMSGMWDAIDVGPRFFETMGIAVVRGRAFTDADFISDTVDFQSDRRSATAAQRENLRRRMGPYVVNESFQTGRYDGGDPMQAGSPIVGIVKDVKLFGVKEAVRPLMFLISRVPRRVGALQVRTAGDPRTVERGIAEAIRGVNPLLLGTVSTLGEVTGRSIAKERMVASISGFFGVLGLVLATMGVFGIASSAVTQRTKELGIRRALGAGQGVLIRDSLRETLGMIGVGLIVGALAAVVAVRVTSSLTTDLLFGITPTDAGTLAASVAMIVLVGVAACAIPALRAARVDPLICIRED